jgi:hypothetical protein
MKTESLFKIWIASSTPKPVQNQSRSLEHLGRLWQVAVTLVTLATGCSGLL